MILIQCNMLGWGFSGTWEWIVILVIALLIFGKRLPDVARNIGKSLTEFKKGIHEAKKSGSELSEEIDEAASQQGPENKTDNQK